MCLLVCFVGTDGSIALAANRDERYDRGTSCPLVWPGRPRILAGRDELAGGTWLALNDRGVVAAVTNRPTVGGDKPERPSRGKLPLLACRCDSAAEAREKLHDHLAATRYNGFNLFVGDAADAFVIQAAGGDFALSGAGAGWHAVGNVAWDDPADVRVARAREMLAKLDPLPDPAGAEDQRVERLMTICRDHHPLGGGGNLCLHGPSVGTVSSTILVLGADRRVVRYLHAEGAPCRTAYRDLAGEDWVKVVAPRPG